MPHSVQPLRFAYLKNGNVVEQMNNIWSRSSKIPDGGPDAFLADFLQMMRHKPLLLLSYGDSDARLETKSIEAHAYSCRTPVMRPIGNILRISWLFMVTLFRLLRFRPHRILCGRQGSVLWAAYIVAKVYRIPLVHSRHVRIDHRRGLIKQAMMAIDNWVVSRVSAVICHGPFTKKQLLDTGVSDDRIFEFDVGCRDILPQGINDKQYDITDGGKNKVILYIGRIAKEKGVFDLFEACRVLLGSEQNVKLVYVGDGRDSQELEKRAYQAGLADRVEMMGKISHDALGAILQQGYILVTPTRHALEGRCMSAMESIVMGVPVIAPNGGPFTFIVKDGVNGLLYETDSVEDLAIKITRIMDDPDLHLMLKRGALKSGQDLLDADVTFSQAINAAFRLASGTNVI